MFVTGAVVTVINVMFVAWLAHFFLTEEKAEIAAFAFYLGVFAAGGFGELDVVATLGGEKFGLAGGVIAGLAIVWAHFFGRKLKSLRWPPRTP